MKLNSSQVKWSEAGKVLFYFTRSHVSLYIFVFFIQKRIINSNIYVAEP